MQKALDSLTPKYMGQNGSGRSGSKWDMVKEESFRKLEEIVARVAYWHGWGNKVTSSGRTGEVPKNDQSECVCDLPVKNPDRGRLAAPS